MVKLQFPNGYTGTYRDRVAEILVKKGRAVAAKKVPAAESTAKPLERMKVDELRAMAKDKGLEGFEDLTRTELIELLKD